MRREVVLLPGLHGTVGLFRRLVEGAPPWARPLPVALPNSELGTYEEVAAALSERLPKVGQGAVVLAESFSGPLAVLLVAGGHLRPDLLVLCASFIVPPASPPLLRCLARLARVARPPERVLRRLLCGGDSELSRQLVAQRPNISRSAVTGRLRAVAAVDVRPQFATLDTSVLAIFACRDRILRRSCETVMRQARPETTVAHIDGPHMLLQSSPRRAWDLIARELGESGWLWAPQ